MIKLDLVIVTYNRLEKLKKALDCYEKQTRSFRNLILVDNCSTDGTREYADDWSKKQSLFHKIVIHTKENLGGAGGFYTGQKEAMRLEADWVYVADDDAYAASDMIEQFYHFIDTHDVSGISAVCGTVLNVDGTISYEHRGSCKIQKSSFVRINSVKSDYDKAFFEINLLSYVGSFINVLALKQVGVANPNYFIFFDDTEHSLRLKKYGSILCVPSVKIEHDTISANLANSNIITIDWKVYYWHRNKQRMLLQHYPFVAIVNAVKFLKHYTKFSGKCDKRMVVMKDAYWDAICGRMGMHNVYKPGWSEIVSL